MKTALQKVQLTILTLLILFTFFSPVFAQLSPDMTVNASIDTDSTSIVSVNPSENEIQLYSDVRVRILDKNGTPLSGHTIHLYVDPSITGETFVQPTTTNSDGYAYGKVKFASAGAYVIRATDTTYSNDIAITSTAGVYIQPVNSPIITAEPYYSKGSTNTIYWSHQAGKDTSYTFQLQVSKDPTFATGTNTSAWVSGDQYTFSGLIDGSLYFYRMKAKNSGGGVSAWSDSAFSVQDGKSPEITLIKAPEIVPVGKGFQIQYTVKVIDNVGVKQVNNFCVSIKDDHVECGYIQKSGSEYLITINLDELSKKKYILDNKYTFCVVAQDNIGNTASNCKIELKVVDGTTQFTVADSLNEVISNFNDLLKNWDNLISSTFESMSIRNINISSTAIMILVYIFTLVSLTYTLILLPNYILFLLTKLLRLLGFRQWNNKLGMVYDGVTSQPIRWSKVKIYNGSNSLVLSTITDGDGNYWGELNTGKYRVVVDNPRYLFPSNITSEAGMENHYRGEYMYASKRNPFNLNIPLDPKDIVEGSVRYEYMSFKVMSVLRNVTAILATVGFIFAAYGFYRDIDITSLVVMILYIPAILLFIYSINRYRLQMKE